MLYFSGIADVTVQRNFVRLLRRQMKEVGTFLHPLGSVARYQRGRLQQGGHNVEKGQLFQLHIGMYRVVAVPGHGHAAVGMHLPNTVVGLDGVRVLLLIHGRTGAPTGRRAVAHNGTVVGTTGNMSAGR